MEESLYHKIREETDNSRDIHNSIIKSIEISREKELRESYFPIELGSDIPSSIYNQHLKLKKNIKDLVEYDELVHIGLDCFKQDLIRGAIRD